MGPEPVGGRRGVLVGRPARRGRLSHPAGRRAPPWRRRRDARPDWHGRGRLRAPAHGGRAGAHDHGGRPLHRPDGTGDRAGSLGRERRADALHPRAGRRGARRGCRPPPGAGRDLPARARRRLERLDRGLDLRARDEARERARRGWLLRPDRLTRRAGRRPDLDARPGAQPAARGVHDAGRRDGRHRLPGPRSLRPADGRRPADPRDARGHRRAPPYRDAQRTRLAPLQRRRLRGARGRERLRRDRDRPRLAAPGRRARPLRAGGGSGCGTLPRDDAPDGVGRRDAARTGLGRRPDPRPRPAPGPSQRLGDAPCLGARGVREAAPLDRPGPRDRPARRRLAPLPRRGAEGDASDLALRGPAPHDGRGAGPAPGAAGPGPRALQPGRLADLDGHRCS